MLKQFIPSEYCLKCLGCCRFAESPTMWAPPECGLIQEKSGYVCEHLSQEDNRCKIYTAHPLDCQLYPFLLVRRGNGLHLGLHRSCCFIQEKGVAERDIQRYAAYLKKKLHTPRYIWALRKNPHIAADYQEDVEIISPLQGVFIRAFIPKLNSLTLRDKPFVERYLKKSKHSISAYHFAALFIWKDLFRIFWIKIEESLCIFYQDAIGMFMALPPLGQVNTGVIKRCFEIMNARNQNSEVSRIENVPEEDIGAYREAGFTSKLKDREYVCLKEDLAALKGDGFKAKRASYNHFVKHYHPEVMAYNKNMYNECLNLYQHWMDTRRQKEQGEVYQQMLEDSNVSFQAVLRYYHSLGLAGYVVKVKGEIKACSFGYPLNKEVFCILFEVCDLGFKGIAQYIFREFAQKLQGYKYINIMGASELENLEKVKLSYRPIKKINLYNIYQ